MCEFRAMLYCAEQGLSEMVLWLISISTPTARAYQDTVHLATVQGYPWLADAVALAETQQNIAEAQKEGVLIAAGIEDAASSQRKLRL